MTFFEYWVNQLNVEFGSADELIAYGTVALVIVTVGLVAVTAYYAVQTRYTVREMKRSSEIQFLPYVIATFNSITSAGNLGFVIKNLGKGAAVDIIVRFSQREGTSQDRSLELLEPDQEDVVDTSIGRSPRFNEMNLEQIFEHYKTQQTTILARINYKDILDKSYTKEYTFDIMALQRQKERR